MTKILVIAEHNNAKLNSATLSAVTAANRLGSDITVLTVGSSCGSVAEECSKISGVLKVIIADAPHYKNFLVEELAPLIAKLTPDYTHIIAAATSFGKDLMPRIAGILGVSQVSDITKVISSDTYQRPIYAGNAFATVQSSDAIKLVTVRKVSFESAGSGGGAEIIKIEPLNRAGLSEFISAEESKSERPELTSAKIVVSAGRGVGSKENLELIYQLADKLGAAVGASRALVDMEVAPNELQVGQTGKVVAPELYIACGISGAIQHLAGMKDSKVIVAINKDENAPIFEIADYGLVADLTKAIPEFIAELDAKA